MFFSYSGVALNVTHDISAILGMVNLKHSVKLCRFLVVEVLCSSSDYNQCEQEISTFASSSAKVNAI